MWALLPLLARRTLGFGSFGYGVLLGCFGAGAVAAAIILPRLRQRWSADALVLLAQAIFAAFLVSLTFLRAPILVGLAMGVGGVGWVSLLSIFYGGVQVAVPAWVRGRAMACLNMVFFAGMAGGSVLWGAVASLADIPATLVVAAICLAGTLVFAIRYRVSTSEGLDVSPSVRWSETGQMVEPDARYGPVLVTVEYRIEPRSSVEFSRAMQEGMRRIRLRTGAIQWGLFRDAADATRYVEFFIVDSWLEHLRQHERFTVSDRATAKLVQSFHAGEAPPVVSHMLYAYASEQKQ
jgi:MFS family permease